MFTGIITAIGTIRKIEQRGDMRATIGCTYDMASVDIGASIACSGVCLTVVEKGADWFAVDISAESLARTAGHSFAEDGQLNLERALKVGDELGGHIVTGHVDGVGQVTAIEPIGDSHRVTISVPDDLAAYVAPKGSITVNGVSLTVNTVEDASTGSSFTLNIIPHTWNVTTFANLKAGDDVNLEIDVLARYLARMEALRAR
ncbi:MAG: riboflavin synthase [Parasphingorhabdus sp.]|nr:riboflavin synthase [Parasphingorhabdus sp.]